MTYDELIEHIQGSALLKEWHWFGYHFTFLVNGIRQPFAASIADACLDVEKKIPGFARLFIDAIAAISGREKDMRHYEQLLQRLAEMLVLRQLATCKWPCDATFDYEPTAGASKKNPEVAIRCGEDIVGIEVKAPSLLDHIGKRDQNPTQIPARGPWKDSPLIKGASEVTWPRDYPVRDFLVSSDEKFSEFKKSTGNFWGLLVLVWDDHIYEPISSLLAPQSGLFTPNSWATTSSGEPLRYPNVDAVVIVRHLHQFILGSREEPLIDGKVHLMDYGSDGVFPFKAVVVNPAGRGDVPLAVIKCLQAYTPEASMGSEYVASDLVLWSTTHPRN